MCSWVVGVSPLCEFYTGVLVLDIFKHFKCVRTVKEWDNLWWNLRWWEEGSGFYLCKERPSCLGFEYQVLFEYFGCFEWTDFTDGGKDALTIWFFFFPPPNFVFGYILGAMGWWESKAKQWQLKSDRIANVTQVWGCLAFLNNTGYV